MSSFRGRVAGAWTGWIESAARARTYLPDATDDDNGIDPDAFPGRWNPVRNFPKELDPLAHTVGRALVRAGWWKPGSGDVCTGGVIVGADGAFERPSRNFATQLGRGWSAAVSPSDFIHALPSTATSLVAKLYGLADYQATLIHGSLSGVAALGHALDLLAVGRLERALVATLSVMTADERDARIAVALCLDAPSGEGGDAHELVLQSVRVLTERSENATTSEADALDDALHVFDPPAALPLVRMVNAIDRGNDAFATHHRGWVVRLG